VRLMTDVSRDGTLVRRQGFFLFIFSILKPCVDVTLRLECTFGTTLVAQS